MKTAAYSATRPARGRTCRPSPAPVHGRPDSTVPDREPSARLSCAPALGRHLLVVYRRRATSRVGRLCPFHQLGLSRRRARRPIDACARRWVRRSHP